jgi:hypothetical protein
MLKKTIAICTASSLGTGLGTVGVVVGGSLAVTTSGVALIAILVPVMLYSIIWALIWKREN